MELKLYQNKSNENTINKDLTLITTKNINLKQSTNLYQTFLFIKNDNITDFSKVNYAKMLNKFYFVSYETIANNHFIKLNLKEDVLETNKDFILNSSADIIEKSTPNNVRNIKTSKEVETFKLKSNVVLPKTQSVIMVTVASEGDKS